LLFSKMIAAYAYRGNTFTGAAEHAIDHVRGLRPLGGRGALRALCGSRRD
jgi:hypothetical protein